MFNIVVLTGRLTADPELKTTQSGLSVTSFSIAVDRRFGSGEERQTDFINIVAWRQQAEFVAKYFKKGRFSSTQSTPRVVIPPLASHTRKGPERRAYKPQFRQKRKRSRGPAGPRRLGTATRISASLSRRLSAFFGSTHDQAPKAAKFAVLNPGHAGFPNRVKRSEGSDTTPTQNATCFAVCALVCDLFPKGECVPTLPVKASVGRL